jgi:hypothetical protein
MPEKVTNSGYKIIFKNNLVLADKLILQITITIKQIILKENLKITKWVMP